MSNNEPTGLPKIQAPVLPAAGQEAVVWVSPEQLESFRNGTSSFGARIPARTEKGGLFDMPLYATPVAAAQAPVGVDVRQLREQASAWELVFPTLEEVAPGWREGAEPAMRHAAAAIRALAQRPAAPGIDNAKLWHLTYEWAVKSNNLATAPLFARALWECAEELRKALALIDASPEGGTCGTCNGHGMTGGLLPAGGGYESEPCPDCSPKGGSDAVATLTIGEAGEEGTQPYFLDRIRETEAFGNLKPGTYQLAVCSMQATSAEVGS